MSFIRIGGGRGDLRPIGRGIAPTTGRGLRPRWGAAAAGFTMVEIALSLAIIGFALVAIIGVLPSGLQVQRDNREETIITQEGANLLEAIRSGAQGLNQLTNFVDEIMIVTTNASGGVVTNRPTYFTGRQIIGYLSTPKYQVLPNGVATNTVIAKIRAQTGSAASQGRDAVSREFAFSYLAQVELVPFAAFPAQSALTNYAEHGLTPDLVKTRRDLWAQALSLQTNLYELRLTLRWPVLGQPRNWRSGGSSQVFRTLVNGSLRPGSPTEPLYFMQPYYFGP